MTINPPPIQMQQLETPTASLMAYVWRGDKFDDIGLAVTKVNGHLIHFDLGADQSEVIELRALKEVFYPGQKKTIGEPKPTFLAFFAGTDIRAGTVWPHDDGKGHRLKLRQSIPDGAEIELRNTGNFIVEGNNRPVQNRRPIHPNRTNA